MKIFRSQFISVFIRALGAVLVISFGRFLGSEGSTLISTPEILALLGLTAGLSTCIWQVSSGSNTGPWKGAAGALVGQSLTSTS